MFIYESRVLLIYCCVMAAILGAVMGSFLNCAAWRIAHHESVTKGRSHCPDCGHTLGMLDLFPVFSWLFLGGKCRYCKKPISPRYPLTELFMGLMSVLCLLQAGLTVEFGRNFIFGCCLFTLALVDLEIYEIPDSCLVISAIIWIIAAPLMGYGIKEIVLHIVAGIVFGGAVLLISLILDKLLHRDSLGGGDIKLFAVMGLYLGFIASLFSLFLSCILGLIFVVIKKSKAGQEEGGQIPFGPAIALATWLMLLFGERLVTWYLGLLM